MQICDVLIASLLGALVLVLVCGCAEYRPTPLHFETRGRPGTETNCKMWDHGVRIVSCDLEFKPECK